MNCKELQAAFAAQLKTATGVDVEVTDRGAGDITLMGELDAVKLAAGWLESAGLMTLDEPVVYVEDIDEAVAYLTPRGRRLPLMQP